MSIGILVSNNTDFSKEIIKFRRVNRKEIIERILKLIQINDDKIIKENYRLIIKISNGPDPIWLLGPKIKEYNFNVDNIYISFCSETFKVVESGIRCYSIALVESINSIEFIYLFESKWIVPDDWKLGRKVTLEIDWWL